MIFADLPPQHAKGAILVHSLRLGKATFRKGRVLSGDDVAALVAAGRSAVTVVRLEPGDVGEDAAAMRLAEALFGADITPAAAFTGRCNLMAEVAGVLLVDRERLDRINLVDEAVTVATLPAHAVVEPREMVATIKVIPFAVPERTLEQCLAIAQEHGPLLRIARFRPRPVGLIQTRLPGVKESVLDKTVEANNARLAALGSPPLREARCDHRTADLVASIQEMRNAGVELLLISGASAITDRRDVVPAAIAAAGGTVDHFGMPVDPGNLLLLAHLDRTPVLGLPGCARSPKLNGFDWVLERLMADVPVTGRDVMLMGVGGLLKEIPSRPQPRAGAETAAVPPRSPRVAAVVLAAGRSTRMRAANKLLAEVDGTAMVVRVIDAALASQARPVLVVTGHEAAHVRAALGGRPVRFVANPDYAEGISTSVRAGIAALGPEIDAALICLGDMPRIAPAALNKLIAAFNPVEGRSICVPTWNGKRGNPVLWARRFFPEMAALEGDAGAKHLIGEHADTVCEVPISDGSVLVDVDTPEALAALGAADKQPA